MSPSLEYTFPSWENISPPLLENMPCFDPHFSPFGIKSPLLLISQIPGFSYSNSPEFPLLTVHQQCDKVHLHATAFLSDQLLTDSVIYTVCKLAY